MPGMAWSKPGPVRCGAPVSAPYLLGEARRRPDRRDLAAVEVWRFRESILTPARPACPDPGNGGGSLAMLHEVG